jgi:hypothetical protein
MTKQKSAVYCGHAHEMPTGASGDSCKCAPDCYCRREGNCKASSRAYVISPSNVKKGKILFWQGWGDVAVRKLHYSDPDSNGRVRVEHVTLGDVSGDDEYLVDFHEVLARCWPVADEKHLSPVVHGQLVETTSQEPLAVLHESVANYFRNEIKSELAASVSQEPSAAQVADAADDVIVDWLIGRACDRVDLDPIMAALLIQTTRFCGDRLPNRERFLKKVESYRTARP